MSDDGILGMVFCNYSESIIDTQIMLWLPSDWEKKESGLKMDPYYVRNRRSNDRNRPTFIQMAVP